MVNTRLLVVRDDSVASRRAVKYVGKFVGKRRAFRICLVHVLPPLPPELLEHGGSEDPAKEAQLEAKLKVGQHRWISAAKKASQKGLHEDRVVLRKAGISARTVKASFCEPGEGRGAADAILHMGPGTALSYGRCRPAVGFLVSRVIQPRFVGRTPSPWQRVLCLGR